MKEKFPTEIRDHKPIRPAVAACSPRAPVSGHGRCRKEAEINWETIRGPALMPRHNAQSLISVFWEVFLGARFSLSLN